MAVPVSLGALAILAAIRFQFVSDVEPIKVTTAEVTRGDISRRVMVSGTLQPARTVEIGSQVSGTVRSIEADFNDAVRAGQIVARLDPSIYEARLEETLARLAQLRAEHEKEQTVVDDAETKLARAEQLAAAAVIPMAELDAARLAAKEASSTLKATAADIAAAQAVAAEAQVSLNYTTIRSPIDGTVIARHVDVGQAVKASVQTPILFTVADTRRMQLLAEIAESDAGTVRPGSKAAFQIESIGNQSFEGTVSSVRLQPYLQQVAAPARGGQATGPQAVTSTPMPVGSSSAQPSIAASPAPTGTSGPTGNAGTSGTAGAPAGQATQQVGAIPPPASGTQPAATSGRAESSAPSTPATAPGSSFPPAAGGVVTYFAVIDVNNADGTVPPGGTAIVYLPGHERRNVVRVPNNALTFRPSRAAFAAVAQDPPTLDAPRPEREQARRGVRLAHVWKFENRRFIPIAVDVGVSDDFWTEIVGGPLQSGDVVVTDAVPGPDKR
jgi:RND family efflux transporter MFP subunit